MKKSIILFIMMAFTAQINFAQEDKYLWLEEVENPKALDWVEKWNEKSLTVLKSQKNYQAIYDKNLEIYNSDERIADPTIYGEFIFNFWQDKNNQRGIWRRTSAKSYISGNPEWETLLDLDKLAEQDNVKWVFKGASGLYPDYKKFLVSLSKGGGDAVVVKEFDTDSKSFVENGFYLPEAKAAPVGLT